MVPIIFSFGFFGAEVAYLDVKAEKWLTVCKYLRPSKGILLENVGLGGKRKFAALRHEIC